MTLYKCPNNIITPIIDNACNEAVTQKSELLQNTRTSS